MHADGDPTGGDPQRGPLLDRADIQVLERLSVESLDAIVTGLVGQRDGPGQTVGFEFSDYRRYTPGDDVRRIDWNIYARLRELHVRTAPQEASLALSVLLDASRSMDSGEPNKLRFGRRLAALLAAVRSLRTLLAVARDFKAGRLSREVDVDGAQGGQTICSALGHGNGGEQEANEEQVDLERCLGHVVKEQQSPKAQA